MKEFNLDKVNKMVKTGLKNGLIIISDDLFDYGVMGIGCKIGDNAFYFGSNEIEDMSLEEYNSSFDDEVTTEMVSNTIWNMINSEEHSDEGWYYISYIEGDKIMSTKEEIRDYLNIGTANEVEETLVANAMEIEKKYETELASGNYGYGIEADFVSSPFILEDEDEVQDLVKIDQIGGVVFYQKLYR